MVYEKRVLPESHATHNRQVTLLSIVDASITRFSPCSAYWIYDAAPETPNFDSLISKFEAGLAHVLDAYPHWAGQIQYANDLPDDDAVLAGLLQRCGSRTLGRPVVSYGDDGDPGVAFRVVEDEHNVDELLAIGRIPGEQSNDWVNTDFPLEAIEHPGPIALNPVTTYHGLPGAAMQVTRFRCGGFAVNLKTAHCLSDATSLCNFMVNWARSIKGDSIIPPHFQPESIDLKGGDLLQQEPDHNTIALARSLPMHRYDWFGEGPEWMTSSNQSLKPANWDQIPHSPATTMPWDTWDRTSPVDRVEISFTPAETRALKAKALETIPHDFRGTISRQDAVLGHIWILVNRARGHRALADRVYLNTTLGMRSRLGLPDDFLGSPIMLMHTSGAGRDVCLGPLGAVASQIRSTTTQGTAEAVQAYIHDISHEPSPQRFWQAFLGSRHLLFTSWLRLPMYEIELFGSRPRYAQGVMPLYDGLLQTIESKDGGNLVVSLALLKPVLGKLLADPELHLQ